VLQIMELRGAKAESERQRGILSEELKATKDALQRHEACLQRNQCDQQVPSSSHIFFTDIALMQAAASMQGADRWQ
jgi:hypothetical protein